MPRSAKTSTSKSSSAKSLATKATSIISDLTMAEIEALLLGAQSKLDDTEATLAAQIRETAVLRDAYHGVQVDLTLARHNYQTAQAAEATAIAEMRHVTQILLEQTSTTDQDAARAEISSLRKQLKTAQDAEAAAIAEMQSMKQELAERANTEGLDAARTELESAYKEVSNLRAQLNTALADTKDIESLRQHVAEQDQRLEIGAREVSDLTALLHQTEAKLLDQSEAGSRDGKDSLDIDLAYGRAAVTALITPPDIERLEQDRLNRAAAALVSSGVFDPEWYLDQYKDVAEANTDPALHFLEFGFTEGRSPRAPE